MKMQGSFDARGWTWITGALALGSAVLGTSCLQVNTGHCMLTGGDVACGEAGFCVGAVGGRSKAIESADAQGCIATLPAEGPSWVHVEYGLPIAVRMQDAGGRDAGTSTVEGIVSRLLEDRGRGLDASTAACQERLEGLGDLGGLYRRIVSEDGRRAAVSAVTLGSVERERILAFNEDVAAALDGLEADCSTEGGTTSTSTGLDTTATGESSSTTAEPLCTSHDECDAPTPFCGIEGKCVASCGETDDPDAACADEYGEQFMCDLARGECVEYECTPADPTACTGTTPICDPATNTCVRCTAHEQCGGAACNLFDGDCLPTDQVVHVGPGQQFTTLGDAVDSFDASNARGTIIVHPGPPDYNESVLVAGGRVLAFLAADLGPGVAPPRWIRTGSDEPQLTVGPGGATTVLIDGLQLVGNLSSTVPALRVQGRAWLDRSRVVDNNGGGIVAETSATLVLRNCFVGGDINDVDALLIDGGTANLSYTTVGGGFGAASALSCDAAADVTARNSLFVARTDADEVACDASIEHSAAELDLGGTNTPLGTMATTWFTSYAMGDFHLTATHPTDIGTAALWTLGDPTTDIDGTPRPDTIDTPDFAGADIP